MKIVFAIKALGIKGGGAERVLSDVASGLAARGHAVTLISSDPEKAAPYYHLDQSVRQIKLGLGNVAGKSTFFEMVHRTIGFRRKLSELRPDVVVAFLNSTYLPLGIALIGSRIPMIASEHIGPEHYRKRWMEKCLLFLVPLLAARITVVSQQILGSFGWWLRRKMVVVSNSLTASIVRKSPEDGRRTDGSRILLTVGRLVAQKNHECLISAFARVAPRHPNWCLRIVGEGELRGALESQVRELGLSKRVTLVGAIDDVRPEYACADLFVMPSTYESIGLATVEALLHGLPAVGFSDCPGTNTVIKHDENGILVSGAANRAESLAMALDQLMAKPQELKRLSNASTDWLSGMFDINMVLDSWERLIKEVAHLH